MTITLGNSISIDADDSVQKKNLLLFFKIFYGGHIGRDFSVGSRI